MARFGKLTSCAFARGKLWAFAGLATVVTGILADPVDALPRFVDVTRQAGIHFRHENAA